MSLSRTKAQLIKLLEDRDNRVLALSGQWGTGKSYMWDEIQRTSNDEQVQKCLYVSLFGVGSINDVKLKLISSTTPQEKNINPL